jgi:hypothetical protein
VRESPFTRTAQILPESYEIVMSSRFNIGQKVQFTSGTVGRPGANGIYNVVKVLPLENDEQHYRIKSATENHERVARESQLEKSA